MVNLDTGIDILESNQEFEFIFRNLNFEMAAIHTLSEIHNVNEMLLLEAQSSCTHQCCIHAHKMHAYNLTRYAIVFFEFGSCKQYQRVVFILES